MKVPPDLLEHKTLALAVVVLGGELRSMFGLKSDMSVAAMSRKLDANREAVYPQRKRLIGALSNMATARPGRLPAKSDEAIADRCAAHELTIRVLTYRVEHLDAVIQHATRSSYAPSFRRFLLNELDAWEGTQAAFAEAAHLPLDTLADWVRDDRAGIMPTAPERKTVPVPVDASETTRRILEEFQQWEGSTKDFCRISAQRIGVSPGQIIRVLRVCGAIQPRTRRRYRNRGTTERLSPGAMSVTDGKTVDILMTHSGRRQRMNWQAMVDQATGCHTAVAVSDEEDAAAIGEAFERSVTFLGGRAPDGLLHDNKPCYNDAALKEQVRCAGTFMVPATKGRPENKAIAEGTFSLFEARVGTIRLDDGSMPRLTRSAVSEILRAYTGATNGVPRADLGGLSQEAALRSARPSHEKRAADRKFIRQLKAKHKRQLRSNWRCRIKPVSHRLIKEVFVHLGLTKHDASGNLQKFLATYEPAAIRQGEAIVSVRLARGDVERKYAHRYLTKVIQNMQDWLDLERQSERLLELCCLQAQDWVAMEREEYYNLEQNLDPDDLVCAVAERAALGGLPVAGAYWVKKLMALLTRDGGQIERVHRFLNRLFDAPVERRLMLVDKLAAFKSGIA